MAAGGGVIPCVLGRQSEILDWGPKKRLFTKAQKLALIERDGGCADVWFIPPRWVDPDRTPRRGARKRFDFIPA
ncbi:hypothetical protein [Microbacterium sp. zg-YB36]|uniref:hypothetical protein n=1 Tax=Microbacterium sp. zg-YB36 TaxID=2969407 RepID=UPI00214C701A|nr:hypothetical protein [Microbacterium sp. zg-YB36]MDL5352337.1 hypothetical protein [Microbacterium sp. zg-YB36]